MSKRILSFLLAFVMVFSMVPATAIPAFATETNAQVNAYEAYVAEEVTIDGSLTETSWLTGGKLSGGQAFDILWDGGNLYFAVVAGETDTALTVKVGEKTILTAEKAEGAAAIEAKVAYNTKDYTTVKNVTLAVGESTWTGDVSLVKYAVQEVFVQDSTMEYKTVSTIPANSAVTAVGDYGIRFYMPAVSATNAAMPAIVAQKTTETVIDRTQSDFVFEFHFDPASMPPVDGLGTIGQNNGIIGGFELWLVDNAGKALCVGIASQKGGNLYINNMADRSCNATKGIHLDLGRTVADGAFDVKFVWKMNDNLDIYINGKLVGTAAYATTQVANMGSELTGATNTIRMKGTRYQHNAAHGYNVDLDFTISNVKLSKPVEVVYVEEELIVAEGTYDAFVAQDITVDGNLSEVAWRAVDKLGAGQPFDILWDGGNLYFGVVASEGDETMLVKVGNEVIADVEKSGNGFEAKVPFNTNGVATLEDVTIKVGNSVWTGDVNLLKYSRVYKPNYSEMVNGFQYFNNSPKPDGNLSYEINGDAITMSNKYIEGKQNAINGRVYSLNTGVELANSRSVDQVIEFDFVAESLPSYSNTNNIGVAYPAYGFTGVLADVANDGITFGIMKASEDGKLYLNVAWQTTDSDKDANCQKKVKYIALDKVEGELFSVRLVWTPNNDVHVYVDGVLKGTIENCLHKGLQWANAFGFNLWGPGSMCALTADGANDNIWTVSNVRVSKAVKVVYEGAAPEVTAYVAPNAANLDGDLSDVLWAVPNALSITTGTDVSGVSYMAWGKGYLYVAADYTGATSMELTLGEKTWTIDLTAADIATADGIITGKNVNGVAELKIDMLKAGVEVLDFGQKAPFQLKLIGETGSAALANGYADLIFSEFESARFTVPATDAYHTKIDNSTAEIKGNGRMYMLLGTSNINHAYDIFYEQTMTINALPGSTGDVKDVHNAVGLSISIMDTKSAGTATVVFAKGEDLWIRVAKAGSQYEDFDLGKKLGETFHFGYLWKTDDSVTLFIDGVKLADVESATYAINWAENYYASNVSGMTGHDVIIKDATHTVFIDKNVPTSTTAGVLNNVTTVSANLPTRYVNGHFAYNVTWATSNSKVIAANGTVTRPSLDDVKVTVAAVIGGQTLEEVEVTVPAELPATLIDGELTAIFTETDPAANADLWDYAVAERFANSKNSAAALIYNQKVYLKVNAVGEVSATLGEETKTATSEGSVVFVFEETAISQYGTEIAVSVSVDGTAAWEASKVVAKAAKMLFKTDKMPINDYTSRVTVTDTTITFKTTDSISSSNCAAIVQRKGLNGMVRSDAGVLFEQTLLIKSMAYGKDTGTFSSATNNNGYTIMLEYPNKTVYSGIVTRDEEGNLSFKAFIAGGNPVSVDLGKQIGEEFKLGLLWNADGSITVYVDDVEKGSVADVRYSGTVYGVAGQATILMKYQDSACSAEQPGEIVASVPTLTIMGGQEDLIPLADEITKEVMFGSIDLENVTMDLPLPTTFRSAFLGDHALTWTTTNAAVVETDGTIHLDPEVDGTATLSVFLDGAETALWSVDVTVPATIITLNALLSEQEIVTDGELNEVAWLDWQEFGSRLPGNIAAAWTKGYLHLGVYSAEADTLKLTINGKEITVDLKNATVTGAEGAKAAKSAKNGTVEISIPLTAIGFNHTDYNQIMSFAAKLAKGETESEAQATLLNLSGDVAEIQSLSSYTKSTGPWTLLGDTVTYKGTAPGLVDYIFKTNNDYLDHKQLIVISNDFIFEALPITTGAMIKAAAQADGFYYYFSDEDATTRVGTTICASIFTEDGTNLKLRIGQGQGAEGYVFDLGATIGEQFRVTYYWYPNNTLDIYVNGALIGTVSNAGYTTSYLGVDVLTYRYYSEKATSDKVRFTITNQTIINTKYESVLDELTQNAVFGRVDLDHVQKNLPMVTSFASANFAALNLKWTSSDESVVATDGTVTRHETEAKSSKITVYFVDDEGNEIKLWDVNVTVDPMTVTKQEAPAIIHTAFAAPGSINVDGVVTDTETWLLNGWVLDADDQAIGYYGAQWDQEYLYLLIDNQNVGQSGFFGVAVTWGGDTQVYLDFNNQKQTNPYTAAVVAFNGNIAEVKIPVSELLGQAKITEYGVSIDVVLHFGPVIHKPTLKLSNVDWWASDNVYAGLPMLANNVKSVKMGTADQPDGNQGAKQLENGWRVYDIYGGEGAANPAGIRTYILFMKLPIYEGFADRTEATQIEFDFYAKALPEWDWKEAIENDIGRAFATYGVTFSLSDKADSAKNSNVAVFGIVNTTEGLMLVVNRGNSDYEAFKLNKEVGEEFRIGMTWLTNANLVLTIDGVEITTIKDMSKFVNSVGDTSFVVNMLRNKEKPTSHDDDMDVYLTNIAFGKAHSSENIIRNLTFADICGLNESENEIENDLILPTYMTNGQLDTQYPITWTSSDEDVVDPATGKVTRPAAGVKVVELTATLEYADGTTESKTFSLIVLGESVSNGNALVVTDDTNPFGKSAIEYTGLLYNLDKNNNSVVYAIPEDEEVEKINLVVLTDLDRYARINRESLRLFVSDDNATYTEIEDYKLHHDGCDWYLYDFEAEARYIKVHYTHSDKDASDFVNTPGEMIHIYWNESLVVPENAAEITAPATTLRDQAVAITLPEGIEAEGLRVALNGEILFHYVDEDGTVYVRIADPTTETLKLWNAEDIELADKENVYEVTYGTRETLPSSGRWVLSVKAGQTYPDGSSVDVDTLYHMSGKAVSASTDGGYTWTRVGSINFTEDGLSSGGWGIDSKTGRMFHEFYGTASFNNNDVTASNCITYVFYSDDGGKTWTKASGLGKIEGDINSTYVLSYTDITELAGNDGEGENVDFVFPMGAQFNNNGAFCGRVAYTKDGGKTWSYSESKITYGNETAFEGGVSEATILEREDGTLVYYARCQSNTVDNFTISYSLDHGVTWLTPGETSSVYTTNTQALMMTYDFGGFDGNRTTGAPIFMWGGNNVLGGSSYMRMPLNFAVSTNEMDTFRNIQNIFSETYMDTFTFIADHYITNPSIQQINGDNMYISFSVLRESRSIYMVVNNFTDWFVRTKGGYDSFEGGTPASESWILAKGNAESTNAKASEGEFSMVVSENTQITRSVPYLQNGVLSIDLYVDASSNFVFELQPAFATNVMKCAVISAQFNGTTATLHDGTVLNLRAGWNTLTFDLELTEYKASVSVNGLEPKTIVVNEQFNGPTPHELGNYITYATILATSTVYVDEFFVESALDAVVEATDADEAAANAVIEQIKALNDDSTDEEILAVKAAYEALTQVQKDLIDRNVRISDEDTAITSGDITDYMINYADVLAAYKTGSYIHSASISLKDSIGVNFYTKVTEEVVEAGATMVMEMPTGETVTIDLKDIDPKDGYYIFKCEVPAKNMGDEIIVKFLAADGSVIDEITYSATDYVESILESDDDDKYKAAAVALANYAAYAQLHFDHNADSLANAKVTGKWAEDYAAAFAAVTAADLEQFKVTGIDTTKNVTLYSASLLLKSATVMRLFFKLADGVNIDDVTFTYGDQELEVVARGGLYYVDITGIAAKNLGDNVTVTINDGVETYDVSYNAMAYCFNVLNSDSTSEDLKDVAKAMYLYYLYAKEALVNN